MLEEQEASRIPGNPRESCRRTDLEAPSCRYLGGVEIAFYRECDLPLGSQAS